VAGTFSPGASSMNCSASGAADNDKEQLIYPKHLDAVSSLTLGRNPAFGTANALSRGLLVSRFRKHRMPRRSHGSEALVRATSQLHYTTADTSNHGRNGCHVRLRLAQCSKSKAQSAVQRKKVGARFGHDLTSSRSLDSQVAQVAT
jgi:hypothetical protein